MAASTRSTRVLLAVALGTSAIAAVGALSRAEAQAPAPSPEKKKLARQYVDAGLAAQAAGDYDQAVTLYQKAYDQVPHPLMFFNIGQAQRLAGRDEEALAAYQKYIAADPKGAKVKEAKGFITEIEPRVIRARADAAEKAKLAADAEAKRKAAEAQAAEAERKRKEAEEAAERERQRKRDEQGASGGGGSGRKKLGLIVGGGGVVLAGAGTVFALLARSSWNQAKDLCDDNRVCDNDADAAHANDLADKTRLRGNLATVFLIGGGAAVAAGVVIYLTAPSGGSKAEHAIRIVPTGDGALATWGGRW